MNAQRQRKNTTIAVTVIVLLLLLVLGIGLFFLLSKPAAPAPVATTPSGPVVDDDPVTPETTTQAPALLGVHTVVPRDTLWWISDKWYKDPVLWPSIYEINKSEISDPDLIYPGQAFDIPALSGTRDNLSAQDKSLLAQGYLEAYRVYKEKGKKDAEDFRKASERIQASK